ncbi:MAG: fused MFS/spermidine synthase [Deltaproteobacteria bacterium]|nr:fused MFS/spermidine synthase [Deltaproteobacteria bacterium]
MSAREGGLTSAVAPLYVLSLLSGVAALGYQVCWSRLLALTFGSTVVAASAVVAGFMGGMGIGAWLYRRVEAPGLAPLRLYGWIEAGIGLTAFGSTLVLERLPDLFDAGSGALSAYALPIGLQYAAVFVLLLPSTALMGATFPALSRAAIATARDVDRHLGAIYGINTLGAAAGALVAGFYLVEGIGGFRTVVCAVGLNLAVAALALTLPGAARTPHDRDPERDVSSTDLPTSLPFFVSGAVLFGSGVTTLGYEILWFRALRYLFGNSTYALTMMLVIFLVGLGAGGLLLRYAVRRRRLERDLAWCQLLIGASALAVIGMVAALGGSDFFRQHISIFSTEFLSRPWSQRVLTTGTIAFAMTIPATVLMGLSFPLASRLFLSDVRRLGARLGGAVLLANLGSIGGAVLAALWLLPSLGTISGTSALAAVNLMLGLLVLAFVPAPRRFAPSLVLVVAALGLWQVLPRRIDFGGGRTGSASWRLVFEEEGDLATVQVREEAGHPGGLQMSIDGTIIGVSRGGFYPIYSKQVLLAHLPFTIDTRIRRVLNIGLGSASTLEALVSHDGLEKVDSVEINQSVVRASRLFPESAALADRRSEVFVDDVLHFLRRGGEPYDLIVSDGKQNLDFSGNAKLLSLEFYQAAFRRLSAHGMLVQWIPLAILDSDLRTILRTIAVVFPEVDVFFDLPGSVLIVASRAPLTGRPHAVGTGFRGDRVAADMAALGIRSPEALLSRWVASRGALLEAAGSGPINRWDDMPLEFSAYRSTLDDLNASTAKNLRLLLAAEKQSASTASSGLISSETPSVRSSRLLREALLRNQTGDLRGAVEVARRALALDPGDRAAAIALENFERSAGFAR